MPPYEFIPEKQIIFRFVPSFSIVLVLTSRLVLGTLRSELEVDEKSSGAGTTAAGAIVECYFELVEYICSFRDSRLK